jgi:hypothetical protein
VRRDPADDLVIQALAASELELRMQIRQLVNLLADLAVEHLQLRATYLRILTRADDDRREARKQAEAAWTALADERLARLSQERAA